MGLDYLDVLFNLEKHFSLPENLLLNINPAITADDLFSVIEKYVSQQGDSSFSSMPADQLWCEFKEVLCDAVVGLEGKEICKNSRLVEDLGFS